ncbi:MBL fold metallo-hydrolase [Calothrix sp. FACHB-1219]|uniref:MBL fold metallo-hydrolase n=1 Tax=unclassified Calothrix TaxID=2619626 RepID=UPI00168A32B6|nr:MULTISPECIES: MBL fold metallo-hydrolase [unclassified Calothrix]MBD2201405.1 MBL fold metallo-hydrolase [Calothrix sp. FACHB-168]MBD2215837.1 MBL fold metallo-hydrolase [Calothrix sp. FACHB-1219]
MSNFELSGSQSYLTETEATPLSHPPTEFLVQLWGVRGLIATPGNNTNRYGGNTACVEMRVAGKELIFDGGTGLRVLGKTWQQREQPIEAHIFFTNSQLNRIQGFPFFAPAFITKNNFHIYGTAASNSASIKQCLYDQMLQPHFPYPLQVMQSQLHFHNLTSGSKVSLDDVTIYTALINQHQRSLGYRISWQNLSVAYITDLPKNPDEVEQERILQLITGVDLLIANGTYNPPTAHNHDLADLQWQTAVDLAHHASVKSLVISHYHPDDDDDFLDSVQSEVKSVFPKALLAREGMVLSL